MKIISTFILFVFLQHKSNAQSDNKKDSAELIVRLEAMPVYYAAKERIDSIKKLILVASNIKTKNIVIQYYKQNLANTLGKSNNYDYIKSRVLNDGEVYCTYLFDRESARIAYKKADSIRLIMINNKQ